MSREQLYREALGLPMPNWGSGPYGTFIYLDGGKLDLGLVRDSTLQSSNDFRVFGEVFEKAFVFGDVTIISTGSTGA